jgi:hypothetical protein
LGTGLTGEDISAADDWKSYGYGNEDPMNRTCHIPLLSFQF